MEVGISNIYRRKTELNQYKGEGLRAFCVHYLLRNCTSLVATGDHDMG